MKSHVVQDVELGVVLVAVLVARVVAKATKKLSKPKILQRSQLKTI